MFTYIPFMYIYALVLICMHVVGMVVGHETIMGMLNIITLGLAQQPNVPVCGLCGQKRS
jgi:hypothetical protein